MIGAQKIMIGNRIKEAKRIFLDRYRSLSFVENTLISLLVVNLLISLCAWNAAVNAGYSADYAGGRADDAAMYAEEANTNAAQAVSDVEEIDSLLRYR